MLGESKPKGPEGPGVIRKEAWPFYRTISGVRLCWELKEPKGPKGWAASWHEIQTKLGATLCGEHRTSRTVRRNVGRRVCRASGAPGARIERACTTIEVGKQ